MSELTPCNHCTYERITQRAHERGAQVSLKADGNWIAVIESDKEKPEAFFLELTPDCVC